MRIFVPKLKWVELNNSDSRETSQIVKQRVGSARLIQKERYSSNVILNAHMSSADASKYIKMDREMKIVMEAAQRTLNLSTRSFYRILKLGRTIADLEGVSRVEAKHIIEALSYRIDV